MDKINTKRWERATVLRCPHLRSEENPIDYRKNQPPSFWLALDRDPCPTCKNGSCCNHGSKFDEPKRLIILKGEKKKRRFYIGFLEEIK